MQDWSIILRFVRDNVTLLLFIVVVTIMGGAWIVFEAIRGQRSRDEVFRLKMRIRELEMDKASAGLRLTDPLVLANRWIQSGAAAATSDGGCLVYVDRVYPEAGSAELTLRVDGYPAIERQGLRVGERVEAAGKYGTYILELYAVDGIRASVAVALRNRHMDAAG